MYRIIYSFFFLFSLLPMRLLYVLSDFVYFLLYHVFKYRRRVVFANLVLALPEKSDKERELIAKRFYHNLLDSFTETIKLFSASQTFLRKRVTANWEVLQPLYESGKSCQMHLGHTFNWEWGHHVLTANTAYRILVVYMPITSPVVEKLMYKLRTRHGNTFISATTMSKSMADFKNDQFLLGLVADQSPGGLTSAYWTSFLGIPTAFVSGPEKAARAGNLPVVFATITKPKRGYYLARLHVATENPAALEEGELTLMYARFMEKSIRANPEMWLWSHRRWKHKYDEKYAEQWIGPPPVSSVQA